MLTRRGSSLGRYASPIGLTGFKRVSRSQYYGVGANLGLGAMSPVERGGLRVMGMGAACDTSFPSTPEPVVIMSGRDCSPLDGPCIATNGLIQEYNNALHNNAMAAWNKRICQSNNCLNVGTAGYPRDCDALFPMRPANQPISLGSVGIVSDNGTITGFSNAPIGTDYNRPAVAPLAPPAVAPAPAPVPTVKQQSGLVPAGTPPAGSPGGGYAPAPAPAAAPPVVPVVFPAARGPAAPGPVAPSSSIVPAWWFTAGADGVPRVLTSYVMGFPVWMVLVAGGFGFYLVSRKG